MDLHSHISFSVTGNYYDWKLNCERLTDYATVAYTPYDAKVLVAETNL